MKTLSSLTGSSAIPLHMNLAGEILFNASADSNGNCSVSIFNTSSTLTQIPLPAGLPCNASEGFLHNNSNFALIMYDNMSSTSPTPEYLLLYSDGQFSSKMFSGSVRPRDNPERLAGFRAKSIVTNFVSGSTTPIYDHVIYSKDGTTKLITNNSNLPLGFSRYELIEFANDRNVVLEEGINGCQIYVGEMAGLRLKNLKRVRKAGSCIADVSINSKGDLAGSFYLSGENKPFIWNRKNRFQDITPFIKPKVTSKWTASKRFINSRGDIALTVSADDNREQAILLTKR
jgi:hypothetical protein